MIVPCLRRSRSPAGHHSSRSPSHSPVRRVHPPTPVASSAAPGVGVGVGVGVGSLSRADDARRLLPRRSRSTHNYLEDTDGYAEPVENGYGGGGCIGGGGGIGGGSAAYRQAAAAEKAERAANREREEEKRRLQVREIDGGSCARYYC